MLSRHCGVISGKWRDVQVSYSLSHKNLPWRRGGNPSVPATRLVSHFYHNSCHISYFASSHGNANVWKDFLLTSCQRDTGALKGGSVHGLTTMCWLLLTRNKFRIYQAIVIFPVCKHEAEWPCGKHGARVPSRLKSAKPPVQYRLLHRHCEW
jgi:hypothetical protein